MYKGLKYLLSLVLIAYSIAAFSQSIEERLASAYKGFENDSQLANAISSLYVIDARNDKVVFQKNALVGLAPASTQKIITAASAYDLLGQNYRYKTDFGYTGSIINNMIKGDLFIKSSGDPTLGSWRWRSTNDSILLNHFILAAKKHNIRGYRNIVIENENWDYELIPDGWIWQDIGNYYGAGAGGFNWRENQYDIFLASGNTEGTNVEIVETKPAIRSFYLNSLLKSAGKGTGDNAYVYYPLGTDTGLVRGTIPVGQKRFSISASYPDIIKEFKSLFAYVLKIGAGANQVVNNEKVSGKTIIYTHYSPELDSIIYWFNRRSINLYGEALIKTIAYEMKGEGKTSTGIKLLKDHWKSRGLPSGELNMYDGSGLSPLNRVTTRSQVTILKYAQSRPWYKEFYNSLPVFNEMKMKSGTISAVKGFTGYHRSKAGIEYIFSFLVNNYNGSSSSLVQKMYKVLDELK